MPPEFTDHETPELGQRPAAGPSPRRRGPRQSKDSPVNGTSAPVFRLMSDP